MGDQQRAQASRTIRGLAGTGDHLGSEGARVSAAGNSRVVFRHRPARPAGAAHARRSEYLVWRAARRAAAVAEVGVEAQRARREIQNEKPNREFGFSVSSVPLWST